VYSVRASGSAATRVTTVDRSKGEIEHRFPSFLPNGRHFLYTAIGGDAEMNWIRVATIGSADTVALVQAGPDAGVFVRTPANDYLLFVRQGRLLAQPFDVDTLTLRGEPILVTEERLTEGGSAVMPDSFSVSANGLIAYGPSAQTRERQLLWVDRSGKPLGAIGGAASYEHVELSPDNKRLGVDLADAQSRKRDIWMIDLPTASATRFTFKPDQYDVPRWAPDGSRVAFARVGAPTGIYEKLSNATDTETQTFAAAADAMALPYDWSPDGRFIVFLDWPAGMATRLSVLPLFGDRQVIPVPAGVQPANGRFSPDGRWLAYQSSDSGSPEVWVQPFPPTGAKWQISHEGEGGRGGVGMGRNYISLRAIAHSSPRRSRAVGISVRTLLCDCLWFAIVA
jgi:hypothetical protein